MKMKNSEYNGGDIFLLITICLTTISLAASTTIVLLAALVGLAAAASTIPNHPLCVDRGDDFFAKPGSCSEVYLCYYGDLLEYTCPHGLWFDATHKYCTYQQSSGCVEEQITVTTPEPVTEKPDPTPLVCDQLAITFYPHEEFCYKYHICTGQGHFPIEASCSDSFSFSEEQSQCVPTALAKCEGKVAVRCPSDLMEGEIAYMAHPSECNSYYLCANKTQIMFSCQTGLVWNPAAQACDHEANVVCAIA